MRVILTALVALSILSWHPAPANATETAYYLDNTQGSFPVAAAVGNWNQQDRVQLVPTATCADKVRCVTIVAEYRPRQDWAGLYYENNLIILNLAFWQSYKGARQIVCHELGHYLNLGHNGHACMRRWVYPDPKPYAGDYNRSMVS